jgi:hypothetical protein
MVKDAQANFAEIDYNSASPDHRSYLLQNGSVHYSRYSVAITYDRKKRMTCGIVHGLDSDEIPIFMEEIKSSKHLLGLPTLLFSLLVHRRVEAAVYMTQEIFELLMKLERSTAQRDDWGPWHPRHKFLREEPDERKQSVTEMDFDVMTKKLTGILGKVTFAKYVCENHLPMMDAFDRVNEECVDAAPTSERERLRVVAARLKANNAWMRSSLQASSHRANFLHKRAKAQAQTVNQHRSRKAIQNHC